MSASVVHVSCNSWKIQCLPFMFSLIAFCLSASASSTCRFLLLEREDPATSYYFGLYRFMPATNGDNLCRDLRFFPQRANDDFSAGSNDDIFKIAKSSGIIAPLMGGIATVFIVLGLFRPTSRARWSIASFLFLGLATLGQLGTFSLFAMYHCNRMQSSVMHCSISDGARRSIAATLLFFLTAVLGCKIPARTIPLISFTYDELSSSCDHSKLIARALTPIVAPTTHEDYVDEIENRTRSNSGNRALDPLP